MSPGLNALLMALAVVWRRSSLHGSDGYRPDWGQTGKDAVWVPTPASLLDDILDMARIAPGDRLLDLGAGDGRILIGAAQRGASAVGVEFDPELVRYARRRVREAGVADRVRVRRADLFAMRLDGADVITFYLMPHLNLRLRPKLLALAPGTRLVSQSFGMGEWRPDAQVMRDGRQAFLWIVPAQAAGTWRLQHDEGDEPPMQLRLAQRFQYIEGEAMRNARTLPLREGRLRGAGISFVLGRLGAGRWHYEGRVIGNTMCGTALAADGRCHTWYARRLSRDEADS